VQKSVIFRLSGRRATRLTIGRDFCETKW